MKEITLEWLAGMLAEALQARGVDTTAAQELADLQEWLENKNAEIAATLKDLAEATFAAADGDSNDAEIESLQEFRDEALSLLKIEVDDD
jgi:hypothetical protein